MKHAPGSQSHQHCQGPSGSNVPAHQPGVVWSSSAQSHNANPVVLVVELFTSQALLQQNSEAFQLHDTPIASWPLQSTPLCGQQHLWRAMVAWSARGSPSA